MDEHITKLNTKIRNKENELNALYIKIQKLEEIAALNHKKLIVSIENMDSTSCLTNPITTCLR